MNRKIVALPAALLISAGAIFANGTDEAGAAPVYPERDIQFVVPFPVGGSTGTPAQILARYLDDYSTDVDVVIGDITGAGGSVGARHVLNSRPDGYTLLIAVPGFSVQNVLAGLDFSFRDFEQVAAYGSADQVLVVRGDSEYTTFTDLIDAAKADPGTLNFGAPIGTSLQLAVLSMEAEMGVDFNIVDIGGVSVKPPELLSGRVEAYIDSITKSKSFIESGDFRVLGIWGPRRSVFLPDAPALNEFGFETTLEEVQGVWAPAGTPREAIDAIAEAIEAVTSNPEFVAEFEGTASTTVRFRDTESYMEFLEEYEATVIEKANMLQ